MLLIRSSAIVLRKTPPAFARNERVWGVAPQQPLCLRLPNASVVSVSGLECKPPASTQVVFDLPREPGVTKKLEHVSFGFEEDDEPAGMTWTFTVSEGEDLIEVLQRYSWSMMDTTDDEYVDAFRRFVTRLAVQSLLLDQESKVQESTVQESTIQKSAESENDVEEAHKSARKQLKSSVTPAKWVAGKARDEEFEQRFRQGGSFLDLAATFERTPAFIFREAKRLFGEAELKKLMKTNKKDKWSSDETQRLVLLRTQGMLLPKITMWLRRTKPSVSKQLQELGLVKCESISVEGPQTLPPGLEQSLFATRLMNIWQGLLEAEMTSTWREALSKKSAKE
jgi:hypothetical protein